MPLKIKSSGSYYATFDDSALTTDRIYSLPNVSGSLLTSNSTGSFPFSASYAVSASYLIGGGGASYPTQTAFKSTDQTTNTTFGTLSYDSALTINVTTSGNYVFDVYILLYTSTTGFCQVGLGGADSGYARTSQNGANGIDITSGGAVGYIGTDLTSFLKISGVAYLSSGNDFKVGYYRNGGGNITCKAGSYMQIIKVN